MVKTAKKIINWAFEDNAGFFISEYPFSFDEDEVTGYFIFKKYRAWNSLSGGDKTLSRERKSPRISRFNSK